MHPTYSRIDLILFAIWEGRPFSIVGDKAS